MSIELKFREDGSFKIVQFTDIHFGDGNEEVRRANDRTAALIERVIAAEQPDFIVLTGDMIWGKNVIDPRATYRKAIAPVANSSIPWASVFGNHDTESSVTLEDLLQVQQESEYCLTEAGTDSINGVGNYVVNVKNAAGTADSSVFYFFDSGDRAPESIGGWSYIHTDQISWYAGESRRIAKASGAVLPALAFFHIPVPEYVEAWNGEDVTGLKGESVCCPIINTGLFAAMIQMGDVMGTFVGHDHDNDYCGTLHGIRMCYGRVTGYNCYGNLPRGARVIKLQEGERKFESYIVQEDGRIIR